MRKGRPQVRTSIMGAPSPTNKAISVSSTTAPKYVAGDAADARLRQLQHAQAGKAGDGYAHQAAPVPPGHDGQQRRSGSTRA